MREHNLFNLKIIPADTFPEWNKQGLRCFLQTCQQSAQQDGRVKIASISMVVKHIDPLAVLESIYEPDELHFYCEHAQLDMAVAGAEAVVAETFSGADRCQQTKLFAQQVLADTIAIGDLTLPFAGPHFFTAFTFFAEPETAAEPFAPATIFLPRWQVARRQGDYCAVANIPVNADASIEQLVEKVWAAHEKFCAFDYREVMHTDEPATPAVAIQDVGGKTWFEAGIETALGEIAAGDYAKIVLARAIDLTAARPFMPLAALNKLRESYPACYAFSIGNGAGASFMGATPERLLRVENNTLFTEAIAGSAPRGSSARQDAEYAQALLHSDKDRREHDFVIESIRRRLHELGIAIDVSTSSRLLKLHNVQHLKTTLQGTIGTGVHVLDGVAALHPTPAVGGMPKAAACQRIAALEPFHRGLYAGAIGWFNYASMGEFVVAIRAALIQGKAARLYAGVGIVDGSVPATEKQETDWKLRALLEQLI